MIRPARTDEADQLSSLCLRSKAHWGYDDDFLALCRDSLRVSQERLAKQYVFVAVDVEDRPVGVMAIEADGKSAELALLFVEPAWIGLGVGRQLFRHAVSLACAASCSEILIASDPGAAPFYEGVGAVCIGMVASDAIPGRELPHYRYDIYKTQGNAHAAAMEEST